MGAQVSEAILVGYFDFGVIPFAFFEEIPGGKVTLL